MELPVAIPLFPLPNVVLFPGVLLPLHIFEPRYRDMVRDAEGSESQMIGMVLLRDDWRERYHDRPDIFPVGCAGRMVRSKRLDDGRYDIVLQGVREFEISAELGETTYRRAEVHWRGEASDSVSEQQREHLRSLTERYLANRNADLARRLLDDPAMSDGLLVNFLGYALDWPAMEKQALLEAPTLDERSARLCQVLEFALGGSGFEGSGSVH